MISTHVNSPGSAAPAVEPHHSSFGVPFAAPAGSASQAATGGLGTAATGGPSGSVQMTNLGAASAPPPASLQPLLTLTPMSLHTMQPLPPPLPNLASLPPHVLREYSPIKRMDSAGSVGSEVPLLGRVLRLRLGALFCNMSLLLH